MYFCGPPHVLPTEQSFLNQPRQLLNYFARHRKFGIMNATTMAAILRSREQQWKSPL